MSRWTRLDVTRHELKQALKATPSKYHNIKVIIDGEKFDSAHEAKVYQDLQLRQKAGEIYGLQRQVHFPLLAAVMDESGAASTGVIVQVATYIADAIYRDVGTDELHVLDAKGQRKRICPYPLKAKWLFLQQGIVIEEV